MFPFRGYLFWSCRLSHRGGGRIFVVFWASDFEKITIFWESKLCEIIAFFRTPQSLCKTKFQKKLLFWGIFPDIFSIMFPFPAYVFTLCFLGGPRRPVGCPKKRQFFGRRKNGIFFKRRRTVLFGSSALFAEHRTSRDQHIQTCQFKTTNVKIHPAVPKV